MKREIYNKIFLEEARKLGLEDVAKWRFTYLQSLPFPQYGFLTDNNEILIDVRNGEPSPREFRRIVRHELKHLRDRMDGRGDLFSELRATLYEFLGIST